MMADKDRWDEIVDLLVLAQEQREERLRELRERATGRCLHDDKAQPARLRVVPPRR